MRKIIIELQVDWEGYEDVSDDLIVEDAIEAKVEGVRWTLLSQLHVSGRSEQLKALLEKLLDNNMCSHAGDELIEQMLKEINCV